MAALALTIFLASLLGSVHCAGMCGAFVAFAVGGDPGNAAQRRRLQAAYNGGRLVTYTLLGALAGLLGATLDLGGSMLGFQRSAAILAGALMVLFGLVTLLRHSGWKIVTPRSPRRLQSAVTAGNRAAMRLSPVARAAAVGLLTTLLPCGWLWAFVITAAGTASPLHGALLMLIFWAGTLPMLLALGVGIQRLGGKLAEKLPLVSAVALVVVGLLTIAARVQATPATGKPPLFRSVAELIAHVHTAESETPACCKKKEP